MVASCHGIGESLKKSTDCTDFTDFSSLEPVQSVKIRVIRGHPGGILEGNNYIIKIIYSAKK
jgi:hypothetical protein